MWANHHGIFRLISTASHGLVVANLFLLLCVAFLPFPTKAGRRARSRRGDPPLPLGLLYILPRREETALPE